MKKIYLLLVALLVSCLYSTQAQAGEVKIDFAKDTATGSFPSSSKGNKTFAYNTSPGIQFSSSSVAYTGTPKKMTVYGSAQGTKLTISTTDETKKMTKIVFAEYQTSTNKPTLTVSSGSVVTNSDSNLEWTSDDESGSNSVTITVKNSATRTIKFSGVTITLANGGGGPTPTLKLDNTFPYKTKIDGSYRDYKTDGAYTGEIKLTGSNLTAGVTATSTDPAILKVTPTTCTKEEAEAGQVFEFTFMPTAVTDAPTITFSSTGAKEIVVTSTAEGSTIATPKAQCETISELKEKLVESNMDATYTGADALVTYVYDNYIYVQDKDAAIRLVAKSGVEITSVEPGDKLTNLEITKIAAGYQLTSFAEANVASSDNTVAPTPVSAADLALPEYEYRLVEVKYGLFDTVGAKFELRRAESGAYLGGNTSVGLDVLGTNVNVSVFNLDVFSDFTTPKGVCTVAGIYQQDETSGITGIYARTPEDIKSVYDNVPELTVDPATVVINTGTQTTASETSFNVTGSNLSSSVTVSTASAGVTFPTAEFAADQFANGAAVPVTLNWTPSEVKEGNGNVTVATTFEYDGQTLTAKANLTLKVLGTPVITTNLSTLTFEGTEENPVQLPASGKITVSGDKLVGAIRIVCPVGITATPNILEMSDNKVNSTEVTITVNVAESNFEGNIELYTEGLAEPVTILVTCTNVTPMDGTATLAEVRAAETEKHFYKGEAVVTYSDEAGFYMQDATAGLYVQYSEGNTKLNRGDKISSVQLVYHNSEFINGWYFGTNATIPQYIVLASGQTVEPTVVGADALAADGAQYADMLVKVTEVKLTSTEGDTFTAGNTYNGTTPTGHVSVAPFAGDIDGEPIPTAFVDVTGIYATLAGDSRALRPRTMADITESAGQNQLVAFITKSENAYTNEIHNMGVSVGLGEFACEFYNLPEGSHATVTCEPAGAGLGFSKKGEEESATADYALTDGTYTLALTATPATGYYRNFKVTFVLGAEATADNTREYTFEPLMVQDPAKAQAATLESTAFVEANTAKLVQENENAVATNLTVNLANCYNVVVVENPVQHPFGYTSNTLTLALAEAQPEAYAETADSDNAEQPLELYPGENGNAAHNLTLTMKCTQAPSATETTTQSAEFNFVSKSDPNKNPLATLKVNYEVTGSLVNIESVEVTQVLYRVYSLQGLLLLNDASAEQVAKLPAGVYIINGKKVSIKN